MINLKALKNIVGHSKYKSWHQLCKAANLNRSAYRYWNGERQLPLETAIKIAYFLNVPLNSFVNYDMIYLLKQVMREK